MARIRIRRVDSATGDTDGRHATRRGPCPRPHDRARRSPPLSHRPGAPRPRVYPRARTMPHPGPGRILQREPRALPATLIIMRNGASGDAARPPWDEAAHRYLAAIVESSDAAIFGKTLDGIIASWNRAAERIYGFTAAEAIGQPVSILVPPEVEDEVPAILERLRRGERIDHYETVRKTKDGRRLNIALPISPIRDDKGRIVGASTIARDVTAQVQARLQLDESRWELEELNAELEQTIEELERQRNAAEAEAERMRRLHRVTAALTGSLEPRQMLEII